MADLLIAGPCSLESLEVCERVAYRMKKLCDDAGLTYVFKGSFDKANRTKGDSPRGTGIEEGLRILEFIRKEAGCPVITDVHETWQVEPVSKVVDVIQIPAMLARQTDLLVEAGRYASAGVMVKKGQAMDVEGLVNALDKVEFATGLYKTGATVTGCLRGTSFGYGDLVMDFRDVVDLRKLYGREPVVDVTHGVMSKTRILPSSIINEYSLALTRAAVAVGARGIFAEIHPDPESAPSDQQWMLPLHRAKELVNAVAGEG